MTDLKLPLKIDYAQKHGDNPNAYAYAFGKEALPFVFNRRGQLVHRPEYVTYRVNNGRYVVVSYYCKNTVATKEENIQFQKEPSGLVCQACEANAVAQGMPASSEIVGRHVHVGRLRPVQVCCRESAND